MLANDRLQADVLLDSENIFGTGKEALQNLSATAKRNLAEISYGGIMPLSTVTPLSTKAEAGDGSYVEIDGNRYVWKNFSEHSNSYSYFLNLTNGVVTAAERGAALIDSIKKNVRVVDKWVEIDHGAFYLHVEKDMELLLFRDSRPDAQNEACRRYRNAEGKNVYEVYITNDVGSSRMIYVPGEKCEYSFQANDGTNHDFLATNTKGYWEVVDVGRPENNRYNVSCMVLKDDICYDAFYSPDPGAQYVNMIKVISADKKTDILWIDDYPEATARTVTVHLQAFDGVEGIEAIEDDSNRVYKDTWQDFTLYSSGNNSVLKTATGVSLTVGDTFLDGKITVNRVAVRHTWTEAGGLYTPSLDLTVLCDDFDTTLAALQEFFALIGLTCRRDMHYVAAGIERAMQELAQFTKYYQWNESPITSNDTLARGFANRDAKFKAWESEFSAVANAPTVDGNNQEQLELNMHFADVTASGTANADGLSVTAENLVLSVSDTMLFVKDEPYTVAFALLDSAGKLHHILVDGMVTTPFAKSNSFSVTGSAAFTLPALTFGDYTLVAYIATADGVRSSGVAPVPFADFASYETTAGNLAIKTSKTESGALLVSFNEIMDIEVSVPATEIAHSYDSMYDALAEHAYSFGFAEEDAMVEKQAEDGSWIALLGTEEILESGVYRLRYGIQNGEVKKSGTVFTTYIAP
jgi:hypothetical protein